MLVQTLSLKFKKQVYSIIIISWFSFLSDKKVLAQYCLPAWTYYTGYCYIYQNQKMNQTQANDYCQSINASLVSVHDKNIIDFMTNLLNKNYFWVNYIL